MTRPRLVVRDTGGTGMKERPIIFSGPMVQAILDGRKTQTRRVVRPQPAVPVREIIKAQGTLQWVDTSGHFHIGNGKNPYGQPGDRLWVRETFRVSRGYDHYPPSKCEGCIVHYEADGTPLPEGYGFRWGKVRSSIHMPRWASRLLLDVVSVRVERVQDISEGDAAKEGWDWSNHDLHKAYDPVSMDTARRWFRDLWDTINTKPGRTWDDNPWVWVVGFKVGK